MVQVPQGVEISHRRNVQWKSELKELQPGQRIQEGMFLYAMKRTPDDHVYDRLSDIAYTCCWHLRLITTINLYIYITTFVSWGFARKRNKTYTTRIRDNTTTIKRLYYVCIICPWKETTNSSTGRKNRYEMNWPLWWNRGATTTTDTFVQTTWMSMLDWLQTKEFTTTKVGTIRRRQIAWIEMHTETPT